MKTTMILFLCAMLGCSASDKRAEVAVGVCAAQDAAGVAKAVSEGTLPAYLEAHGAEFALCAMRAWSNRNAAGDATGGKPL